MSASIVIEPLTAAAFAAFGTVMEAPAQAGRTQYDAALSSLRPHAAASLSMARIDTAASLPLEARQMERHAFSSQSFIPLGPVRMLVVVAPHAPEGGPDARAARAFLAEDGMGVTYRADVWHHPLTVLAAPASLAVLMWRDGGPGDEEFVDVEPFIVRA